MPYFNVQRWSLWWGVGGRGGVWMVPEGKSGMKATETEAGRHIQTEMLDAGAAVAA